MIVYKAIETDDGVFRLSDSVENEKFIEMPDFTITKDHKEVDYYDSPYFLLNAVYPYLQNKSNDISKDFLKQDIEGMEKYLKNDKEELLEIFEEAFRIGMLSYDLLK